MFRGNALRDTFKSSIERKRIQIFIPHDKFSQATHRIDASIQILTTRNAGWENFDEKNVARETTGTIKISTYSKPLIKVILWYNQFPTSLQHLNSSLFHSRARDREMQSAEHSIQPRRKVEVSHRVRNLLRFTLTRILDWGYPGTSSIFDKPWRLKIRHISSCWQSERYLVSNFQRWYFINK